MKIDLYTKAVLTVIAIGIGFLVFEQSPVKEVHAGYHDNNGRLQLMNRMARMERNFKRLESDFVVVVKDFRRRVSALERKVTAQGRPGPKATPPKKVNSPTERRRQQQRTKRKIQICERKWVMANLPVNNRVPGQRQAILEDFVRSNCCGLELKPKKGGHKSYCASRRR